MAGLSPYLGYWSTNGRQLPRLPTVSERGECYDARGAPVTSLSGIKLVGQAIA